MSNKTLIALDLGSITGFAVQSKHGLSHGTMNFKVKGKFHDSGYKKLYDWLRTFEGEVEMVVECPHASLYFNSVRILFGLLAVCHLFADEHKVKLTEVKPTVIKKFATGSGAAKKEAMVAAVQKHHPGVTDNNEADAVWILRHHLESR